MGSHFDMSICRATCNTWSQGEGIPLAYHAIQGFYARDEEAQAAACMHLVHWQGWGLAQCAQQAERDTVCPCFYLASQCGQHLSALCAGNMQHTAEGPCMCCWGIATSDSRLRMSAEETAAWTAIAKLCVQGLLRAQAG